MALGADSSLSGPARMTRSPLAPKAAPKAAPAFRPFAVDDNRVDDATSNQRAAGIGAGRAAMSEGDRAGISRGTGQQYQAQIAETAANQAANAEALNTEQSAALANRSARQAYDNTMSDEALANQTLLERIRSSDAAARNNQLARGQNLYQAFRRGQFGLDSQQLDYSPLLSRLLEGLGG